MRILIVALVLAFQTSLAAADIALRADRMAPGSMMIMQDSQGLVTHVKRGVEAGQHVFDTFAGKGASAVYIGSYTTNDRGDVTAMIASDGAVTRFAPHRCNRTPGRCDFTITHVDGFKEPRTRVTEATANGLRYQEYGLNGLVAEGALDLDGNGLARKGWKKEKSDSRKTRTKRVLIALK